MNLVLQKILQKTLKPILTNLKNLQTHPKLQTLNNLQHLKKKLKRNPNRTEMKEDAKRSIGKNRCSFDFDVIDL